MADAYSIMAMAKTQGAQKRAQDEYDAYIDRIEAEETRAAKAMSKGSEGAGIFGSISSFFMPALLGLVPGAGLLATLGKAILATGVQKGATELGDVAMRQWSGEGSKEFADVAGMKDVGGIYGKGFEKKLKRGGERYEKQFADEIAGLLDLEQSGRWKGAITSGLVAAGQAASGAKTLEAATGEKVNKALEKSIAEGMDVGASKAYKAYPELMKESMMKHKDFAPSIAEKMQAAMRGSAKEGWISSLKSGKGKLLDAFGGVKEAFKSPLPVKEATDLSWDASQMIESPEDFLESLKIKDLPELEDTYLPRGTSEVGSSSIIQKAQPRHLIGSDPYIGIEDTILKELITTPEDELPFMRKKTLTETLLEQRVPKTLEEILRQGYATSGRELYRRGRK